MSPIFFVELFSVNIPAPRRAQRKTWRPSALEKHQHRSFCGGGNVTVLAALPQCKRWDRFATVPAALAKHHLHDLGAVVGQIGRLAHGVDGFIIATARWNDPILDALADSAPAATIGGGADRTEPT